jgi:hypothetical protein
VTAWAFGFGSCHRLLYDPQFRVQFSTEVVDGKPTAIGPYLYDLVITRRFLDDLIPIHQGRSVNE